MKVRIVAVLVTLALGILLAPLAAQAQQGARRYRIGFLSLAAPPTPSTPSTSLAAFREGLRALGYVEGQNFAIESRFADARTDRLPELAVELVQLRLDVIVTIGTPTALAAKNATATIPVVMAGSADPVEHGLVASLARPRGNVTGLTHSPGPGIAGKGLQLLKEAVPKLSHVAILWDSSIIHERLALKEQQVVALALRVTLVPMDAKTLDELTVAFGAMIREHADGLFVFPNFINGKHQDRILDFAATNRLPTMFQSTDAVKAGGLMSYYTNWAELRRHTAVYVDKILRGAKPADLPVEQPTKFELVINLNERAT